MNVHGGAYAAHGVLYVILEVALNHPHESLVTRNHLSRQSTVAALLHQKEVLRSEGGLAVPHVDIRFA